jgi:hypothetical protein
VAGVDGPSDAQAADARVWMQAARAWVIERHPYLDVALTSMILVARPGMGTVAVDARWRLYYDPMRVLELQRAHGIKALGGDWVHEVMHLLRDHPVRWEDLRDAPSRHRVFNMAADALVNTDVADLGLPVLATDVTVTTLPPAAGAPFASGLAPARAFAPDFAFAIASPIGTALADGMSPAGDPAPPLRCWACISRTCAATLSGLSPTNVAATAASRTVRTASFASVVRSRICMSSLYCATRSAGVASLRGSFLTSSFTSDTGAPSTTMCTE